MGHSERTQTVDIRAVSEPRTNDDVTNTNEESAENVMESKSDPPPVHVKAHLDAARHRIKGMRSDLAEVRNLFGKSFDVLKLSQDERDELQSKLVDGLKKWNEEKGPFKEKPTENVPRKSKRARHGELTRIIRAAAAEKLEAAEEKGAEKMKDAVGKSRDVAEKSKRDGKKHAAGNEAEGKTEKVVEIVQIPDYTLEEEAGKPENAARDGAGKVTGKSSSYEEMSRNVANRDGQSENDRGCELQSTQSNVSEQLQTEGDESKEGYHESSDSDEVDEVKQVINRTIEMQIASMDCDT